LAFLSVSAEGWARSECGDTAAAVLRPQAEKKMADKGESAWTPNVSHILALAEALKYIKEIGMDKLVENAQMLAGPPGRRRRRWGWSCSRRTPPASSVTAIKAPAGMDSGEIVKGFRNQFGSIIANGQGTMKGQIFRIAHLGYFDFADLFAMVAELELILHSKGVQVEFGKGVAAVQKIYAEAAQLKAK
jgi:aspartate aminotransferase-like enzyme